jgi:hypothetical protein
MPNPPPGCFAKNNNRKGGFGHPIPGKFYASPFDLSFALLGRKIVGPTLLSQALEIWNAGSTTKRTKLRTDPLTTLGVSSLSKDHLSSPWSYQPVLPRPIQTAQPLSSTNAELRLEALCEEVRSSSNRPPPAPGYLASNPCTQHTPRSHTAREHHHSSAPEGFISVPNCPSSVYRSKSVGKESPSAEHRPQPPSTSYPQRSRSPRSSSTDRRHRDDPGSPSRINPNLQERNRPMHPRPHRSGERGSPFSDRTSTKVRSPSRKRSRSPSRHDRSRSPSRHVPKKAQRTSAKDVRVRCPPRKRSRSPSRLDRSRSPSRHVLNSAQRTSAKVVPSSPFASTLPLRCQPRIHPDRLKLFEAEPSPTPSHRAARTLQKNNVAVRGLKEDVRSVFGSSPPPPQLRNTIEFMHKHDNLTTPAAKSSNRPGARSEGSRPRVIILNPST